MEFCYLENREVETHCNNLANLGTFVSVTGLSNQQLDKSVLCERSTLPLRCGERGLIGRNFIDISSIAPEICKRKIHLLDPFESAESEKAFLQSFAPKRLRNWQLFGGQRELNSEFRSSHQPRYIDKDWEQFCRCPFELDLRESVVYIDDGVFRKIQLFLRGGAFNCRRILQSLAWEIRNL
jgi:hypothetical protein